MSALDHQRTIDRSKILFSRYECVGYAVFQMMQGALTLRISGKNGKNKPKIVYEVGKKDKLIKDYLEIWELFRNF